MITSRARILLAAGTALLAASITARVCGLRVNITHSYPVGLYRLTGGGIEKGGLVIFCPPDNVQFRAARERGYIGAGFCPGGYEYMIKKLVAVGGDRIAITAQGVWVNGEYVVRSASLAQDSDNRTLNSYKTPLPALPKGKVLLMSDYSAKSFDGRYFGPLDAQQIIAPIRPLWTWD